MNLLWITAIISIVSLILLILSLIRLGMIGEMTKTPMSKDEAADFTLGGGASAMGNEPKPLYEKSWFKGKAVGASWGGEISTKEIIQLIRTRQWRRGLPWAIAALATIAILFAFPLTVLLLCGADPFITWVVEILFVTTTIRAAWPRD